MVAMIFLLLAIGVGVATQVPRLRAHYATTSPARVWDHFLVASGLRPVPATMPDVVTVAAKADIPATMLDRAALGRDANGALVVLATLTNNRVLIAVRRDGPMPASSGLTVADGWRLQVLAGPASHAWDTTLLRATTATSGHTSR